MLQILLPKLMFLLIGYSNIKKIAVGSESKSALNCLLSALMKVIWSQIVLLCMKH